MSPKKLFFIHIFSSLLLLTALVGGLFFIKDFIQSFLINPQRYISTGLSQQELYFAIIFIGLNVIAVLFSYLVYLLLTYNSRFNFVIWEATKQESLSKEQFMRLYDEAPVPYILLDKKAEIYSPNKAALRFFGVVPEEIQGKNIFSYVTGEDEESAEKLFRFYKSGSAINRKELNMVTKKGDVRTVELSIFEMKKLGSFDTTGLAMIFDVTEEKMLDRAKTEFVSLASHQLRTPLATTKWLTEILSSGESGELNPKQKEYVEKLHISNENMVDLVDTLLNVSRIEIGTLNVDLKPTNVEELCESIITELAFLINKKHIIINKDYGGNLVNIESDPKLLRIVIQNLISNAVKYTPEGGAVSISLKEDGGDKKIIVADTGVGIPLNQRDRIFTKLFRADNVRMMEGSQGTGLGLYLVKSVIGTIGGSISFVSEEGKGSEFTINLK